MLLAKAQIPDLVIKTNHTSGVEILQRARFDHANLRLMQVYGDARIYLGEVDFGENGDRFKASSIIFANGWYVDGWAILHAGDTDYESSIPFTQMMYNETGGYQHYYTYGSNMGFLAETEEELSGGKPAVTGLTFEKPTGRKKVWLSFAGDGVGNIKAINFYENELTADDFVDWGYDADIRLREPYEREGYADEALKLLSIDSTPLVPTGEGTDYPETRIDDTSWGWTKEGFIADYGEVNLTEEYQQVLLYFKHGSPRLFDGIEVYLDEIAPENLLGHWWTGIDVTQIEPYARDLPRVITGTHRVIALWYGGSTNVDAIEFVKGHPYPIADECGVELEDVQPDENAFHFTYRGCPEMYGDPWTYEVIVKGQYESAGNIGYTGNGTVINFFDDGSQTYDGVDFGNNPYKRIIVNHSCNELWTDDIENSNFSFYLDLDPDHIYSYDDWKDRLPIILEGHEPFAVVRLQGTGNWSLIKSTAAPMLYDVTGKHEIFMVYNTPTTDAGANVWDIYLDWHEDGEPGVVGDVTGDGVVDIADVNAVINIMLGKMPKVDAADVTGDNAVDIADVNAVINIMLGK